MAEVPSVFISYSHDSPEHANRILALANRLRREGVDCDIDQYEESPPEGWPRWCDNQVEESKFVLVACTDTYLRRFKGQEEPGKGSGVTWEGYIITQELYDAQGKNTKFIPIVFSAGDTGSIPVTLRGGAHYNLAGDSGYDDLYRRLTGQPRIEKPPLGDLVKRPPDPAPRGLPALPARERNQDFYTDDEKKILKELANGERLYRNRHSVAKATGIEYKEVNKVISKLARYDLVDNKEVPGEDRRIWRITPAGRRLLQQLAETQS